MFEQRERTFVNFRKIYDISVTLGLESITYPGDEPFRREVMRSIEEGAEVSRLIMSSHSGTHMDASAHFIKGGKRIHEYNIERFILPARVIEIKDPKEIKLEELEKSSIPENKALLFKTRNSMEGISRNGKFTKNFVHLSEEAADYCVKRNIPLVGIDYITIEKVGSNTVHKKLLGNDIIILEGINLKNVPQGEYLLVCLPLKIMDGEGSPVRAILISEY